MASLQPDSSETNREKPFHIADFLGETCTSLRLVSSTTYTVSPSGFALSCLHAISSYVTFAVQPLCTLSSWVFTANNHFSSVSRKKKCKQTQFFTFYMYNTKLVHFLRSLQLPPNQPHNLDSHYKLFATNQPITIQSKRINEMPEWNWHHTVKSLVTSTWGSINHPYMTQKSTVSSTLGNTVQ